MANDNYDEKYTKPELRRELKAKLKKGDKGGEPGQWSARKSQMLVQQYEKNGGGYKKDKKDDDARSLEDWSEQHWQTRDGSANADRKDGMKRYLPADAWALLQEKDQDKAERSKAKVDNKNEQFADWPQAVRDVMAELDYISGEDSTGLTKDYLLERARELDVSGRSTMNKDELKAAILDHPESKIDDATKEELYERARKLDIKGRSSMNKEELKEAIEED